jgi:hypothetical protein
MDPATRPARNESFPMVAETVWIDWGVNCTGSEP